MFNFIIVNVSPMKASICVSILQCLNARTFSTLIFAVKKNDINSMTCNYFYLIHLYLQFPITKKYPLIRLAIYSSTSICFFFQRRTSKGKTPFLIGGRPTRGDLSFLILICISTFNKIFMHYLKCLFPLQ